MLKNRIKYWILKISKVKIFWSVWSEVHSRCIWWIIKQTAERCCSLTDKEITLKIATWMAKTWWWSLCSQLTPTRLFRTCNQVPATHVARVWQELDYMIDICRVTKGGLIEHLQGRTETWSVSPSVQTCFSSAYHPGYCTAEVGNPRGL